MCGKCGFIWPMVTVENYNYLIDDSGKAGVRIYMYVFGDNNIIKYLVLI